MTPWQTAVMLQGHYRRDLQASLAVMASINLHQDPKRSKPVRFDDVSVFPRKRRKREPQTPEEQARILKNLALIFGSRKKREKNG